MVRKKVRGRNERSSEGSANGLLKTDSGGSGAKHNVLQYQAQGAESFLVGKSVSDTAASDSLDKLV